jgi:hypothetical protein
VKIYLHVKSGRHYAMLHTAIDTTNARNGGETVVYRRVMLGRAVTELVGPTFVRDAAEFHESIEGVPRFALVTDSRLSRKSKTPGPKS